MPHRSPRTVVGALALTILTVAVTATAAITSDPAAAQPVSGPTIPFPRAGRATYLVELATPGTAVVVARQRANGRRAVRTAATTQLATIRTAQDAVIRRLPADAAVLYRSHAAVAAVTVRADAADLATLRALPGVTAVHPIAPKSIGNATAIPLQGAPTVWQSQSNQGQDTTVAIIDTGIDYTHADFGGPGTTAAYTAARRTSAQPASSTVFPSPKIIGGYDLVGDSYGSTEDAPALPDANPLDCNGHGSHVAGSAAGLGVNANGTPYAGSYGTSTPFGSLKIGPGMAPRAKLYAYKVFGCTGSTSYVGAAIDLASDPNGDGDTSDHVDVISMSLGSDFGGSDDGDAVLADGAVDLGIAVIAAAGNAGDYTDASGTPGNAAKALAVASSRDSAGGGATSADVDRVSTFSSRGIHADGNVKPDVTAVGDTVSSAAFGTGSGAVTYSGTSMATPMVAGLAALVITRRPAWTAEQVKADIMNTAGQDLYVRGSADPTSTRYGPVRVGAGRIKAADALTNEVLAYNATDDASVSVSFGPVEAAAPLTRRKTITVENTGATTASYTAAYTAITSVPGVGYTVSPSSITLAGGTSTTLTVTLRVTDPSVMTRAFDPTIGRYSAIASGSGYLERATLAEAMGRVDLTPTSSGRPALRVPVYAAPRPASTMTQPSQLTLPSGSTQSAVLTLSGSGLRAGTAPTDDIASLVQPSILQATSGSAPACTAQQSTLCYGSPEELGGDLRYVGYSATADQAVFTVVTWAPRAIAAGRMVFEISIDVTGDGVTDFYLVNIRRGEEDVFATQLFDATGTAVGAPTAIPSGQDAATTYDSDVWSMPVQLSALTGITRANPRIGWGVRTYVSFGPQVIDQVGLDGAGRPTLSANVYAPGLTWRSPGAFLMTDDQPGRQVTITRNPASYRADRAQGLLMVHQDNRNGDRAQVVRLRTSPTVVLRAIPAQIVRGQRTLLAVTVTDPDGGPPPTGLVLLVDTATGAAVARASLRSGTASLGYAPTSTVSLRAVYQGSGDYTGASSAVATVTVTQP